MANKININQNQLYSAAGALDPRFIVDSVDKITSISNAYVGLEVSVIDSEENIIGKYKIKKINSLTKKPLPANEGGYELILEPKDLKYSDGETSFLNEDGNINSDPTIDPLPPHSSSDNGKVLGLDDKGTLTWVSQPDTSGKVDKVAGKGLSTNDYSDTDKNKVNNMFEIPAGASENKVLGYENGNVTWVDKPQDGEKGDKGDKGKDAVNPFKGYYPTGVSLPDTGAVGDYLYSPPSDPQSSATATIWHYDANKTPHWTDTGIDVSNVVAVEFGSGQSVPATKIKDENGEEVQGPADVLSAEAGMELGAKLQGVSEEKVLFEIGVSDIMGKFVNGSTGDISTSSVNSVAIVDVRGFKKVRFSGVVVGNPNAHPGYAFCNLTSGDYPNNTLSNISIQEGYYVEYKHGDSTSVVEYNIVVPSGVSFMLITNIRATVSNFYAYKQNPRAISVNHDVLNSDVYKSYQNVIDVTTGLYKKSNSSSENDQFYHGIIGLDGVSKIQLFNIKGASRIAFLTAHGNTAIGENSNAILLSNGKYCYTYQRGYASGIIDVPVGAKYLYFTKYYDGYYPSTTDFLLYRDSEIKVSEKHSMSINLCGGALSTSSGKKYAYTASTNQLKLFSKSYSNERLIEFNPMYDSIDDYDISLNGGTLSIYCFSEKGKVMLGVTTNKDNIPIGTTHIRLNVSYDTPQDVRDITVDLKMSTNNGNTFNTIKSCGNATWKKYSDFASFFSLEIVRPRIFNDTENTAVYYGDSEGRDFATAYIFFSKDYSNTGKPSKVLLNFHGTTSFNIGVISLSDGAFAVRQFLAKCGYTVIDVTTDTWYTANNYNYGSTTGMASDYPTPLAFACWSKVLEYCLDVYNLDADNIYAVCKSSGGLNCVNFMNKFTNYKIKAAALMAPSIDLFANIRASYNGSINAFLMQIGCANPNISGMTSNGIGIDSVSNANRQYFEANKELIQRYNPMLNGIVTDTFDKDELMDAMLDGLFATRYSGNTSPLDNNSSLNQMIDNSKIVNRVPFKIWHAIDDENVPYTTSKWYVKMCQNAGCECYLRQWPANTGRHYFDSFVTVEDDNVGPSGVYTPTLIGYTTKFGEVIQANPAYCEVIDWLDRW